MVAYFACQHPHASCRSQRTAIVSENLASTAGPHIDDEDTDDATAERSGRISALEVVTTAAEDDEDEVKAEKLSRFCVDALLDAPSLPPSLRKKANGLGIFEKMLDFFSALAER